MVQHCSPRKWHGVPGFISWPKTVPTIQPSQHAVHVPQDRDGARDGAGDAARAAVATGWSAITLPQHFLYFLPLPQGQGSFRATLTGP